MQKKLLAFALASIFCAGVAQAEIKDFKVNGEKITAAEQQALYDAAVKQGYPAGADLERQVKSQLVQQHVLLQEAEKAKLEKDPDIKKALENARNQTLIQAMQLKWAKEVKVTDQEIKDAYDNDKASYGDTEYKIRIITVKTEDQAKNLIKRLGNKNTSFDKLAKDFSEDANTKDKGGEIGWVVPRQFPAAFSATFTALQPGQVAQTPIRMSDGFVILKLDEKRAQKLYPSFDSQKNVIKNAFNKSLLKS